MKLALAALAALSLASLTLPACSTTNKSGEYACTTQADCADLAGRVCNGGYCVVTGDTPIDAPGPNPMIDAPPRPIDAPPMDVCPAQCSSCDIAGMKCNIDCAQSPALCNAAITCPAGWDCDIKCTTPNSCRTGVSCINAAACTIDCSGDSSCRQLNSGPGPFDVTCTGQNACRGLDCDPSCACDIECGDTASCEFLRCSTQTCGVPGGGCTSSRTGCDTCQ